MEGKIHRKKKEGKYIGKENTKQEKKYYKKKSVRSGIRTHAHIRGPEASALYRASCYT